jgi:hypothetical protein
VTADRGGASRRAEQGGHDLQEGRLAGPVGTQEGHRLAGSDVEVDAIEDALGTEDANETDDTNEWYGHHASSHVILAHRRERVKNARPDAHAAGVDEGD